MSITANKLASMTIEERLKHRQLTVKPLVDAYFTWAKQNLLSVMPKSKTAKGLTYSLNQEKYLKTFLEDGEVPMDNNSAEQAITAIFTIKSPPIPSIPYFSYFTLEMK